MKGLSRVAALLVQLLTASEEPTSSGAELASALADESLALSLKQTPTGTQGTLCKASLRRRARSRCGSRARGERGTGRSGQNRAQRCAHARVARRRARGGARQGKTAAKDLAGANARAGVSRHRRLRAKRTRRTTRILGDEDDLSTQLDDDVRTSVMERAEALADGVDVPFCGPKAKAAKMKTARVPTASRSRASKTAAANKLVDDDLRKPLPKVTPERPKRSSRRGALQETN